MVPSMCTSRCAQHRSFLVRAPCYYMIPGCCFMTIATTYLSTATTAVDTEVLIVTRILRVLRAVKCCVFNYPLAPSFNSRTRLAERFTSLVVQGSAAALGVGVGGRSAAAPPCVVVLLLSLELPLCSSASSNNVYTPPSLARRPIEDTCVFVGQIARCPAEHGRSTWVAARRLS